MWVEEDETDEDIEIYQQSNASFYAERYAEIEHRKPGASITKD